MRSWRELAHHPSWFHLNFHGASNIRYPTMKAALTIAYQAAPMHLPLIVETGCQREPNDWGAGASTTVFGHVVSECGGQLITVDNCAEHILRCREFTKEWKDNIRYFEADSVEWLRRRVIDEFTGWAGQRIDLLYLDSLDFPLNDLLMRLGWDGDDETWGDAVNKHMARPDEEILAEHRDLIEPAQLHCEAEIRAALPLLAPRAVVLLDDAQMLGSGKVRLAREVLLEHGFTLIVESTQSLWWRAS